MRKLILLLLISTAMAQTTHSVTLTWTDTANPAGTTYTVKRSSGLCTGTPTFATMATAVAGKAYTDLNVGVGNWCYVVTAVLSGVESVPSNLASANVPPFAPVALTFTVK
jgi:hypothetical protein